MTVNARKDEIQLFPGLQPHLFIELNLQSYFHIVKMEYIDMEGDCQGQCLKNR